MARTPRGHRDDDALARELLGAFGGLERRPSAPGRLLGNSTEAGGTTAPTTPAVHTRKNPMTGIGQMLRGGKGGAEVAVEAPVGAGLVLSSVSDGAGGFIEQWVDPLDLLDTPAGFTAPMDIQTLHPKPLIAAHRGLISGDSSYPENTVESLRAAILMGAEIVEYDVRLSSDGTFWLMHDATVDRTTNGTGAISGLSDATLAGLAIDAGFGYDAGRHGTSLDVPRLIDVLDALQPYDALHHIQLNVSSTGNATALAEFVLANGRASQMMIEVSTLAEATAIKAVSLLIEVAINESVSGAAASADVDWLTWDQQAISGLAAVTALAPKRIGAYVGIAQYGENEVPFFAAMLAAGVTAFQTNDLETVLPLAKAARYAVAHSHPEYQLAADKGQPNGYAELDEDGLIPLERIPPSVIGQRYEVVLGEFGSGPEPVEDDDGDWLYAIFEGGLLY